METEHLLIEDQEEEDLADTINLFSQSQNNIREHANKMTAALKNTRSTNRTSIPLPNEKGHTRVARIREALEYENRPLRGSMSYSRPSKAHRETELRAEKEDRVQRLRESYSQTRGKAQLSKSLTRLPYGQRGRRLDFSAEDEDRENFGSHTQDHRTPNQLSGLKNRTPFHSTNIQEENETNFESTFGRQSVTHNRFKRPVKDQQKSLQNYQEKYNRLEQNFKRFTANMMDKKTNRSLSRHSSHRLIENRQTSPVMNQKATITSREDDEGLVGSPHTQLRDVRYNVASTTSSNFYKHGRPQHLAFQSVEDENCGMANFKSQKCDPDFERDTSMVDEVHHAWETAHPRERIPRMRLLENVIVRVQTFMETCFSNLEKMCLSKQQEGQIQQTEAILQQLQQTSIEKTGGGNDLSGDSEQVYQAYARSLDCLDLAFKHAVTNLFSVDNQTYLNHKFREIAVIFEDILQESHRLNLYQLLPSLMDSMTRLRAQTAFAIIKSTLQKKNERSLRDKYAHWRQQANLKYYITRAFKQQSLTRAIMRIMQTKNRIKLARYIQIWKSQVDVSSQIMPDGLPLTQSIIEAIFSDSDKFNACLQSDYGLNKHIREQLTLSLEASRGGSVPIMCDLLFLETNGEKNDEDDENCSDEEEVLRHTLVGYDTDRGHQMKDDDRILRNIPLDQIDQNRSLTSQALQRTTYIQNIYHQQNFNEFIDGPMMDSEQKEDYQNISDLNMLAIALRPTPEETNDKQIRGILRVFSPGKIMDNDIIFIEQAAASVGNFFERVQQIRWQLGSLQEELKSKQIQQNAELFERLTYNCVFELLQVLPPATSKIEFLEQLQIKVTLLVNEVFPNSKLRQIYFKDHSHPSEHNLKKHVMKSLLPENQNDALIRPKEHMNEHSELLEDFLDYRSDFLVQQISIELFLEHQSPFSFIFHRHLSKDINQQQARINQTQRDALMHVTKMVQPVLVQSQIVVESLTYKVENQANVLHRQLKLNKLSEDLRSQLQKLTQFQVQSEACIYLQNVLATVLVSSDSLLFNQYNIGEQESQVRLINYACALNSGVLTGDDPMQSILIAYLNKQQNQLLEMVQVVAGTADITQTDEADAVQRYESSIKDFYNYKQEFQAKSGGIIYFKLPIFAERTLVALFCAEIQVQNNALSTDYNDNEELLEQIKYLLKTIQTETASVLMQNVHIQTSQTNQFRECFDQLQGTIKNLTLDVEFLQAVQHQLVIPFTQSPSVRQLGFALANIVDQLIPSLQLQSIGLSQQEGRDIADVRMVDFSIDVQTVRHLVPEKALTFDFNAGFVTLCLEGSSPMQHLILSFAVGPEPDIESNIIQQSEIFHLVVESFVKEAMRSLSSTSLVSVRQQHLPRLLANLMVKKNFSHVYTFFSALKELQVNKVPIFTRLKSFQKIMKKYQENNPQQDYGNEAETQYQARSQIRDIYKKAFGQLNSYCIRVKHEYFQRYKAFVYDQMLEERQRDAFMESWQPTKFQRKAISRICRTSRHFMLKNSFAKWTVKSGQFHALNRPDIKECAAALCIIHNAKVIKARLAFQKMRAHASDRVYRDFGGMETKDREYMSRQVHKLLKANLNCQEADQNLERALQTVLEQSMAYLQETLNPEQLDLLVVTIRQPPGGRKALAYVFNSRIHWNKSRSAKKEVQRVSDVIDNHSNKHIGLLVDNLEGLGDFQVSFKRDIILQMLSKSQTMFNFGDIRSSLYPLYNKKLAQMEQTTAVGLPNQDQSELSSRLVMMKKSKSALIVPLQQLRSGDELDEPVWRTRQELIDPTDQRNDYIDQDTKNELSLGSIELYRFHQQAFDEDVEKRMHVFAKIFASDVMPVYYRLRETLYQMETLRQRTVLRQAPLGVPSLSALLRSVHFNAPAQLQASQVLPILVSNGNEYSNPLAYFYQFRDNHIYSFAYAETFVAELVQHGVVLEVTAAGKTGSGQQDMPGHRKRTVDAGLVKSVTNGKFKHIIYYPVLCQSYSAGTSTRAILEVSFGNLDQVPKNVRSDQIQTFLEQFASQMSQQEQRMRTFCKLTEGLLQRKFAVYKSRALFAWRSSLELNHQKRTFMQNHEQALSHTEICFSEYMRNMENYDVEIRRLTEERDLLSSQVHRLKADRFEKYRHCGAALVLLRSMLKQGLLKRQKEYFNKWKFHQKLTKVAESAFNKILELNHRHSLKRFDTACYLLQKSVGSRIKRNAMNTLFSFVQMQQLRLSGGLLSSQKVGMSSYQYPSSQKLGTQNSAFLAAAHEPFSNMVQRGSFDFRDLNKIPMPPGLHTTGDVQPQHLAQTYQSALSSAPSAHPAISHTDVSMFNNDLHHLKKSQCISFGAVPSQGSRAGGTRRTSATKLPKKQQQRSTSRKTRRV